MDEKLSCFGERICMLWRKKGAREGNVVFLESKQLCIWQARSHVCGEQWYLVEKESCFGETRGTWGRKCPILSDPEMDFLPQILLFAPQLSIISHKIPPFKRKRRPQEHASQAQDCSTASWQERILNCHPLHFQPQRALSRTAA